MRGTSFLLLLVSLLGCSGLRPIARPPQAESAGQAYQPIRRLSFLGEAVLESGLEFEGTTVGGLSALTYDSEREIFYALTDDPSFLHPSRLYGLEIDLAGDQLETGMVSITSLVVFRDKDGRELPTYTVDGEGLALTDSGSFFVASEGNIERGIQPSIREVAADGSPIRELALPEGYLSDGRGARGLRHNLAFEALTLTPEKTWLFAGIENALIQDGPEADLDQPSPGRILRYDLLGAQPPAEYLYWVAPVPEPSARPDGFKVNGLVELLALEGHQLLALERSFSAGVGNAARLYLVDLTHAEDIHGMDLHGRATDIRPAALPSPTVAIRSFSSVTTISAPDRKVSSSRLPGVTNRLRFRKFRAPGIAPPTRETGSSVWRVSSPLSSPGLRQPGHGFNTSRETTIGPHPMGCS
jgi:hypothetical protein